MLFDHTVLSQVASDVCGTMLGLQMHPSRGGAIFGEVIVATVQISGEWVATVEVVAARHVAKVLAARMFSRDPDILDSNDVFDALGEVANMIGGNLKGIANSDLDLSVPSVEIRELEVNRPSSSTIEALMTCAGGPLLIRLIQSTEIPVAA